MERWQEKCIKYHPKLIYDKIIINYYKLVENKYKLL